MVSGAIRAENHKLIDKYFQFYDIYLLCQAQACLKLKLKIGQLSINRNLSIYFKLQNY